MRGGVRVLAVVAHPDDEVLGCGGTLAAHARAGHEVRALVLAEGATSRDPERDTGLRGEAIEALQLAARRAAREIGALAPLFAGLPDNRLDVIARREIVERVATAVRDVEPQVIYTHHGTDLNLDHCIVHDCVLEVVRYGGGGAVRSVRAFETVSSTEWMPTGLALGFRPNLFIDISTTLDRKLAALRQYAVEMRASPHPRSYDGVQRQARARGATVGVEAAEAFRLVLERHLGGSRPTPGPQGAGAR